MAILVLIFIIVVQLIHIRALAVVVMIVGFVASIVLTFLAYGQVMKWVTARFELQKHLPQLFKSRRR
jgi:ABC-type nickel/cobalt efflux system permease component RcnA